VIYLTGLDKDAVQRQGGLNAAFLDDRVGIAAQVMCMIKGSGHAIVEQHPFHRHMPGDELPRVAVFAKERAIERRIASLEKEAIMLQELRKKLLELDRRILSLR